MLKKSWPILLLLLAGCSNEPFAYVKIHGSCLYEDGTTIPAGQITLKFEPQSPPVDEKTHPIPGMTILNEDGTFDIVTSHKYADGVVRGEHKVIVMADGEVDGQPVVPKKYTNSKTTPLVIHTDDPSPFDLRIEKP